MRNIKGLGKKFKKGKKDADSLSTGGYPKVVFGEGGGEGAVGERNGDEPDSDEDEESLYDEVCQWVDFCVQVILLVARPTNSSVVRVSD